MPRSLHCVPVLLLAVVATLATVIISSDTVHARGNFNPKASACFTTATDPAPATCDGNSAPGAKSNILSTFELHPAGDLNFAAVISFTPSSFTVPKAADVPLGAEVAQLKSLPTLGLVNGPCASLLPVDFTFINASVDTTNTITPLPAGTVNNLQNLAEDENGNGIPNGAEKYPSYLNTLFKNQQPRARYYAQTSLAFAAGLWVILQFVVFEPGIAPNPDVLPPLDTTYGFPNVTVLQDPTAAPSPSAVTDFCSSLRVKTVVYGESKDNLNTSANEAGFTVRQNPSTDTTANFVLWARSQRDLDEDSYENALDTCPDKPNAEDPRQPAPVGDPDLDAIDSICDPAAGASCYPGSTGPATDCDNDQYLNRGDNCPLVSNNDQKDNDLVFGPLEVGDGIGNACDPNPSGTLDGHNHEKCVVSQVAVGAGGTPADVDFVPCGSRTSGGGGGGLTPEQQQQQQQQQEEERRRQQQQTGTGPGGAGGPGTGVGSLAPVAASIPAWAAIASALGGAGLLGGLGAIAARLLRRRRW